jgi:Zn-finger nucleic acid-binding protein
MKCPRCETSVLDERERNGVTVDVCGQCRGVWLDRGELEKLLAFAQREVDQERAYYGRGPSHDHDREPPSSDRRHGYGQAPGNRDQQQRPYKKKSWLENLGDIFD